MKLIVQISRIFVGCLFIFSGFIKANDPLGFSYKNTEYFEVLGMHFMIPIALPISIFICAFEIVLGFALLLGYRSKLTVWLLLLMIIFFTFLTFYSAYFEVVKECGCFGDFWKLSPWESFSKDVILLVLILILLAGVKHLRPILQKKMEKNALVLFSLASFVFPIYIVAYLPVFDFRPYAIGKNIPEGMTLPPDAVRDSIAMVFIYEKNGQKVEIGMEQIKDLDSTYKYVDRIDKVIREGDKPAISDFSIVDLEGNNFTEQILNHDGYYFFVVCYDLSKSNRGVFGRINDFEKAARQDHVPVICLTATADLIGEFKNETGAELPFYLTDQIVLKTMIRSNPGIMLLNKGTVVEKWPYRSLPSYSEVKQKHFPN